MRRTFTVVALVAGLATSVQAQKAWQTEIGIQGGFSRLQAAGTGGNPVDGLNIPGFHLGSTDYPAPGAVFVIVPLGAKIALEPGIAASQISVFGATASVVGVGLRANYAVAGNVYAALGGNAQYAETGGETDIQLGLQAGIGYRLRLAPTMNGRLEVNWTTFGESDNAAPLNSYSLLFGVSTPAARAGAPRRAARTDRAFSPVIGIQGGYTHVHIPGQGGFTFIAAPLYGGGLAALGGLPLVTQPTLFAVIPVGRKTALEPGLDVQRFQGSGTTSFAGNLSVRLDYAFNAHWYAAAGPTLQYYKITGTDAATVAGLAAAGGVRFPLTSGLGGRFELNYAMMQKADASGFGEIPANVLGLLFGVTMPLK